MKDISFELVKVMNLLHEKAQTSNGMRLHAASGKPTADMHYFEGSARAYADSFLILHNAITPILQEIREDVNDAIIDLKYKYGDNYKINSILRSTQGEILEDNKINVVVRAFDNTDNNTRENGGGR